MLIFIAILLFFLLLIVFVSTQLSSVLENNDSSKVTYSDVEVNVKNATVTYVNDYYEDEVSSGTLTITTENLIKYGVLKENQLLPSDEKNSCKGYALVYKELEELVFEPYIKCTNYETRGYQGWRLGE